MDDITTDQFVTSSSKSSPRGPKLLGIWRLGSVVHRTESAEITLAQPADASQNPRWDYVIKRGLDVEQSPSHRQFIAQAAAASQVAKHPNLVCVLDGSVSGSHPFVVMPRIEGRTLQQHLSDGNNLALPVALWLTRQTAQAITTLHAGGWIHGDIKPANILVSGQGHATVIDLGFARRIHTPLGRVFRGTPEYASPEMLESETAALPSMDVFSLGRMLWQSMAHCNDSSSLVVETASELVASMIDLDPDARPTAASVVDRLLKLEIDALGSHIEPVHRARRAA
ncbi:serine/threonine protein kinase [Crateriforma conspicua]|uniref:non-specific serine/threonine protein kinase n=1 Tax=Crateriforma conspicua TaxID=2527996 RepID=A0A5C6FRF4_9PLAN|nr:protein kinase family protein [Crateriforma conspicua]TWU65752.1 Serine/threonine-protein kinase PK-1 [Crateriforma conspicua]